MGKLLRRKSITSSRKKSSSKSKSKAVKFRGIEGVTFRPIRRNRDEKGFILTYSAKNENGIEAEFNTLGEAKVWAAIVPEDKDPNKANREAEEFLKKMKKKK